MLTVLRSNGAWRWQAKEMRRLRALYKVGIEFTGWPTRPAPTPLRGPALADARFLPIDLLQGACKGRCALATQRTFQRTTLGKYHH